MLMESESGIQLTETGGSSGFDGDIGYIRHAFGEINALKQGLHQRHIQMIALAGIIGTGVFLSSGQALAMAGPLGAFLAYSIVGIGVSSVVQTVGEMGALVPLSGGLVRYAEYFFDPAILPAEIIAASVLVEFWVTIDNAIWITVFSVLVLTTALVFVRIYREVEFAFAILKILLVIGMNIMVLVITCGGGLDGESIGFRYWRDLGPFIQYLGIQGSPGWFLGFWTSLQNAVFSYSGIQNITIPAAETRSPRQSIPRATRRLLYRILLFYVLSIFMIGLVVPSNDPTLLQLTGTASQSPFIIAARRATIKTAPSVINAIFLTSAWSAGNSNIIFGSRILYGMAVHGHAPAVFKRLNRFSVPYMAISCIGGFLCLGYMSLSHPATVVFQWLRDVVAVATLVDWLIVCIVYLRFYYGCKNQGVDRHNELPWAAPYQPYFTWASLILFALMLITGGYSTFIHGHWDTETFVASYINIPIVLGLYFGYKFWKKTRIIPLETIPLVGLIQFYLCHRGDGPEPQPRKGFRKFNILW